MNYAKGERKVLVLAIESKRALFSNELLFLFGLSLLFEGFVFDFKVGNCFPKVTTTTQKD
jgi:hypothetical protein